MVQACSPMSTPASRDGQASSVNGWGSQHRHSVPTPAPPQGWQHGGTREGSPAPPASSPCWLHVITRGLPSSFLPAAPAEGKGTKGGDARPARRAGALPRHRSARGAAMLSPELCPHRGTALPPRPSPKRASHGVSPPPQPQNHEATPGSPLPLLTGPSPAPPPHPYTSRGRAWLSPAST